MRCMSVGLPTPFPLRSMLPPVLQEDRVAGRLTAGLDEVLAPIIATLDCLAGYVDPQVAPPDFLEWLGGWVGVALDENWSTEQQRATVARAVGLHRARGTVAGMRRYLEVATGGQVEILDSGGVVCSTTPDATPPGDGTPHVLVRVTPRSGGPVDLRAVDALVATLKPAHIVHRVEAMRPAGPTR